MRKLWNMKITVMAVINGALILILKRRGKETVVTNNNEIIEN